MFDCYVRPHLHNCYTYKLTIKFQLNYRVIKKKNLFEGSNNLVYKTRKK
jgi:hypothetical protein